MKVGGWEDTKTDFRKKLKDSKEAILLEQQSKSVKGDADVDSLIAQRLKDIEREPQNMNFRRALADLYVRAERFDEALQALADATQAAGRSDPQIERTASQIKVKKFDVAITAAKEAGDAAAAEAVEKQRAEFLYNDAVDMVKRYPNDLQFRYELGYQYYLRQQYNEAIEEFQLAQRNPQRRTRALYHLALCFTAKNQLDIAFEQLQKAASELTLMDETKKDVVYEMGVLAEKMGRTQEAIAFFKEIYGVDIKFRDISQRIEAAYQKK
jgi:TolA-binding protein